MEDLIKREDAIRALHKHFSSGFDCDRWWNSTTVLFALNSVPSADRPQGEWIKHKERTETNGKFIDFFPAEYECSNCGLREAHYFINSKPHNYCPNCGAKMKQ